METYSAKHWITVARDVVEAAEREPVEITNVLPAEFVVLPWSMVEPLGLETMASATLPYASENSSVTLSSPI